MPCAISCRSAHTAATTTITRITEATIESIAHRAIGTIITAVGGKQLIDNGNLSRHIEWIESAEAIGARIISQAVGLIELFIGFVG